MLQDYKMFSFIGVKHLIDNICVTGVIDINHTIIDNLRYLENIMDNLSHEEHAAVENWYKLMIILKKTFETLSNQEQYVLKWRFGLEDGKRRTQHEVGLLCGLTASRISQVEKKALRKLRHPSRSRLLVHTLRYASLPAHQSGLPTRIASPMPTEGHP